jgi:naphthoate synthase
MNESDLKAPIVWNDIDGDYSEILYHKSPEGIAKITINRPHVRNAFTPVTVNEMRHALNDARDDARIGVTSTLTEFNLRVMSFDVG